MTTQTKNKFDSDRYQEGSRLDGSLQNTLEIDNPAEYFCKIFSNSFQRRLRCPWCSCEWNLHGAFARPAFRWKNFEYYAKCPTCHIDDGAWKRVPTLNPHSIMTYDDMSVLGGCSTTRLASVLESGAQALRQADSENEAKRIIYYRSKVERLQEDAAPVGEGCIAAEPRATVQEIKSDDIPSVEPINTTTDILSAAAIDSMVDQITRELSQIPITNKTWSRTVTTISPQLTNPCCETALPVEQKYCFGCNQRKPDNGCFSTCKICRCVSRCADCISYSSALSRYDKDNIAVCASCAKHTSDGYCPLCYDLIAVHYDVQYHFDLVTRRVVKTVVAKKRLCSFTTRIER